MSTEIEGHIIKLKCIKIAFLLAILTQSSITYANWSKDITLKSQASHQFFTSPVEGVENNYSILELQPQITLKKSSFIKIQFEPYFYHKEKVKAQIERNFWDIQQGYLELQKSKMRLRLGSQIYNWGSMDFYSPLDVVNTQTLFDPLSPTKLGATGIDASWNQIGFSFQAIYLPSRRPSQFPEVNSRWLPRQVIINPGGLDADLVLPDTLEYSYEPQRDIDSSLKNNWGLKLSKTINEWDLSLVYFEGVSQRPQVEIEVDIQTSIIDPETNKVTKLIVEPDVRLTPLFYKQRVLGTSLVWASEWGIFKLEGVTSENLVDLSYIEQKLYQAAFSFEKTYNPLNWSILHQIQYYKSWEDNEFTNTTGANYRLFDNTVANHFLISMSEKNSILSSFILDIDNQSQFYVLGFRKKLNDIWNIEFKNVLIQGREESLGGTYKSNDLIEIKVVAFF